MAIEKLSSDEDAEKRTNSMRGRWTKEAKSWLEGKKIVTVQYQPDDAWGTALVLIFDDNTLAFVSTDDEGNGPGALLVQKDGKSSILPQL